MKVSDFRSSMTQGKFLAKKGVWISEHRIESGLNCGGHAFVSDGYLLGPILEEFSTKRIELVSSLLATCNNALAKKNHLTFNTIPETKISVQGGIGTAKEDQFVLNHYHLDSTGWASPFLLVPEVTTLDVQTRDLISDAQEEDLYLSDISPLGVPFNTLRGTDSETLKLKRIEDGKPGSPCPKGHLVTNTEFTTKPICTASILYQKRKLEALKKEDLDPSQLTNRIKQVLTKACLCEDLAASVYNQDNIPNKRPTKTAVCPGPNVAYFSKMASLSEMVGHIYGRLNLLNDTPRSNMFISELKMYINYFKKELKEQCPQLTKKQTKYFQTFRTNLEEGMEYYKKMIPALMEESLKYREVMKAELLSLKKDLENTLTSYPLEPINFAV